MKNFPKDPDRDYSISNAEIEIIQTLYNQDCYGHETQKKFYKLITSADIYFDDIKLAIFIDGEQIHRDKEFEDQDKRDFVRSRGCIVREYSYHYPLSVKRKQEIVASIKDDVVGLRKMKR